MTHWGQIIERFADDVVILDLSVRSISIEASDNRGRLFGRIQHLVERGWIKILLNCVDVWCIDSGGLEEIVLGLKAAKEAGGAVKMYGASADLRRLLALTKLDRHLETIDSEQDAFQSFAAGV